MEAMKPKPCPFCGSEAVYVHAAEARVSCDECPATVKAWVHPGVFKTYAGQREHEIKAAIAAWNRRAPEGAGEAEPVAWLIENENDAVDALKNGRAVAMRRLSHADGQFFAVAPLSSLSSLQSRNQELEAEVERLTKERDDARRKLFPHADANPICGFSYGGFNFISDEKGIAEFRRLENNANQIAVWRRSFDENLTAYKARAEAAEAQASSLKQQLDEAGKALEPFAREADQWIDTVPDNHRPLITEPGNDQAIFGGETVFSVGDLRRARRALEATTPTNGRSGA